MKLRNHIALAALLTALLTGCCDGSIEFGGLVTDAASGEPMDSVSVNFFYAERRQATIVGSSLTDSTGQYGFADFGYCSKTRFFIVLSHPGYRSQTLDVAAFDYQANVQLERE